MENTIYLGLSRQVTLNNNMQIIANNVANLNTPGYRGQNLLFHEFVSEPRGFDDPLSFVYDEGQYQDTASGSFSTTGNPLDIALAGPGFIGINGAGGQPTYTRDGNFQKSADGRLVTSSGAEVSGLGGGAITIPPDSTSVSIDEQGFVSNQNGILGQIKIVEFDNIQELEPLGSNQYRTDAPEVPAANTVVRQGQLEGSNVNAVLEMTRMIDTLRSFQSVHNLLNSENERLRDTIQQLTGQG